MNPFVSQLNPNLCQLTLSIILGCKHILRLPFMPLYSTCSTWRVLSPIKMWSGLKLSQLASSLHQLQKKKKKNGKKPKMRMEMELVMWMNLRLRQHLLRFYAQKSQQQCRNS